ncbi:alpha/beta hydrolase family protein [Halocynthiibacter namhaensis]|uniref:alpha/beta hydrolase family protein n=1 Tax=Halocynthiibacter namhaensis TaxID=1290553 RepID=UPI00068E90DD|nr:alpha/beta fold hydrolase [Halocynthiibacter namhaensis]
MRKIISISLFSATLPALAAAQHAQEIITLQSEGQDFVGTLMLPSGDPAPVVLLLHGFTGSRDELTIPSTEQGVFVHTANSLATNGYASLRIDFRGSGESTSDFTYEATTFEGQVADAMAAVAHLKASNKVNGDDIHVIGWSQGGLVASAVAGRSGNLDAVALWQAVGDADASYGGLLSTETLDAGKATAPDQTITAKLPWGAEVMLNGAFFDGIEAFDPMAEITAYSGPLFVSQGMADTTVLPEIAAAFIAAHEGPEQLWSAEMDHVFNVFAETETLDSLIGATLAFFKENED